MRASRTAVWAACLAGAGMVISLAAAPGDLDPTFEVDGKLTTEFTGWARGVVVDHIGRIVITGFTEDRLERLPGVQERDFLTARYNSSGISLDGTFGDGLSKIGTVITNFSGTLSDADVATAVTLDAAGRIVVAGWQEISTLCTDPPCDVDERFALARYTAQGIPDATFGPLNGRIAFDFGDNVHHSRPAAIAIDDAGRVVVAGTAYGPGCLFDLCGNNDFAVARLLPNGDLDSSFSGDGKILVGFGGTDHLNAMAIDSQGRIIVVGTNTNSFGTDRIAMARFLPTGQLDSTFGDGGRLITNYGRHHSVATGVATDAEDRIVVGGWAAHFNVGTMIPFYWVGFLSDPVFDQSADFAMTRYLADGTLDTSFGTSGRTFLDFAERDDIAFAMTVDDLGRFILVGSAFDPDFREDVAVARFTSSGRTDLTFGLGGKVTTRFNFIDVAQGVTTDNQGRILVTGFTWPQGAEQPRIILARYDNGGGTMARTAELVGTFGEEGIVANAGITEALTAKLTTAEKFVESGDLKTAGNVLGAFISQVESQAGKHIATSATLDGVKFDPTAVLIGQARGLINDLNTPVQAPLFGYVTDSGGNGLEAAAIRVVDATGKAVISGTTDAAGFYYVVGSGTLKAGAQYSVQLTMPAGYATASPQALTFTWKNARLTLPSIVVN